MEENERRMLHDIHSAVVGNKELGHEGLVHKVERHEKWINSAKVKLAALLGGCAVVLWLFDFATKVFTK